MNIYDYYEGKFPKEAKELIQLREKYIPIEQDLIDRGKANPALETLFIMLVIENKKLKEEIQAIKDFLII